MDHLDMAPRLDAVWATAEKIQIRDICSEARVLGLDVVSAEAKDLASVEALGGEEVGSVVEEGQKRKSLAKGCQDIKVFSSLVSIIFFLMLQN